MKAYVAVLQREPIGLSGSLSAQPTNIRVNKSRLNVPYVLTHLGVQLFNSVVSHLVIQGEREREREREENERERER